MKDDRSKNRPAENGGAILSRRSLFELAGMAVATAALRPGIVMAKPSPGGDSNEQGVSPVMQKLSTYMSEASGHALPDEVEWILASANQGFEGVNLTRADVISTYAGLRPLVSRRSLPLTRAATRFR